MTKQIKLAFGAAIALAALSPAAASAAPNFSGKWMRETAQSNVAPYPNYWLVRVAPATGGMNRPVTLQVQQSGSTLQVSDNVHPQRTYTLDGREHTMPTDTMISQVRTSASLKDDTLTISSTQPYGGMPGNVPMRGQETWTVSPDGKTLTILTVRDLPATRQVYAEVYTRQ